MGNGRGESKLITYKSKVNLNPHNKGTQCGLSRQYMTSFTSLFLLEQRKVVLALQMLQVMEFVHTCCVDLSLY